MTTAQGLIDQVRGELLSGVVEHRNKLGAAYTAGSGSLTFANPLEGISAGCRLSIGTNVFHVWSVNNATTSAVVSGGEDGATDANAANGATVRVAPRFTDLAIFRALNAEIVSLSSPENGLYRMLTKELTFDAGRVGYDLAPAANFLEVYEVRFEETGSYKSWPLVPKRHWRVNRNAETDDFASGVALEFFGVANHGRQIRVLYKAEFSQFAAVGDNLTVTGLPTTAEDLLVLAAQIRLMPSREIKRAFTEHQGDTRRAAEVRSGDTLRSYQGLELLRNRRIQEERTRLANQYPDRRL